MLKIKQTFPLVSSFSLLMASVAHGELSTDFSNGLEGWNATGGIISFKNNGGNTGGFLKLEDSTDSWMKASAPSKFTGNLSSYMGGSISFDAINISGQVANLNDSPWFGTLTIIGNKGSATTVIAKSNTGNPPNDGNWHTYSSNFNPSLWSGNLHAALSDVTKISIVLEFHEEVSEIVGFDNFSIKPVPLRAALPLFPQIYFHLAGLDFSARKIPE